MGLDLTGSGKGPVAGSCEFGTEPSGSIKGQEFLEEEEEEKSNYQLLKKYPHTME
jgi:hypothetical protein